MTILLPLLWGVTTAFGQTKAQLDFYGTPISFQYESGFGKISEMSLRDGGQIEKSYVLFKKTPYRSFLQSMQAAKQEYALNDWLYFKLMHDSVKKIHPRKTERFRNALLWFLLAESGYDARVTFNRSKLFVNVASDERVFESPMYEDRGRMFINLSAIVSPGPKFNSLSAVLYTPRKTGKKFKFSLNQLPSLESRAFDKSWVFDFKGKEYKLSAVLDETFIDLMREYPKFDEFSYVTAPLSKSAKETLLPQLSTAMKGMDKYEAMEFLVSFTRFALQYGSDKKAFGSSKPLSAEEALFYPTIDCEDKVAVIYNLVKELTDLQAVVIALPEHLSFAVDLGKPVGKPFRYKGKSFTVCDPTGPENTSEIGYFPPKLRIQSGEVMGRLNF